jgi:GWxTD domain-containing protein
MDHLKEAENIAPETPQVHYLLALAHYRLSHFTFGRADANQALKHLEILARLDPSHQEVYHLQGLIYKEVLDDPWSALPCFQKQVEANPSNLKAVKSFLETCMDLGEWERAIEIAARIIERTPEEKELYPLMAGALWKAGKLEEAMQTFTAYFDRLEKREYNLYFDLSIILTPAEAATYTSLDTKGKETYWDHYWKVRDPDLRTTVNERLLEHFIRVAYSRLEFGDKTWPWDDRGNLMIRYGEPDEQLGPGHPFPKTRVDGWEFYLRECDLFIRLGLPVPVYNPDREYMVATIGFDPEVNGSGTPEEWIYLNEGMDIHLENPVMNGSYRAVERSIVQRLERRIPTMSGEEDRIEDLHSIESIACFRGQGGRTRLEYSYGLPPDNIGITDKTPLTRMLSASIGLYTPEWIRVDDVEEQHALAGMRKIHVGGIPFQIDALQLQAPPGTYRLTSLLRDPVAGRQASADEVVDLPDFTGEMLMISDILPAALVRPKGVDSPLRFIRGNLEVLPLPGRVIPSDQPLFVYYEIYNLRRDTIGSTEWEIRYSVAEAPEAQGLVTRLYQGLKSLIGAGRRLAIITNAHRSLGIQPDIETYLEIDLSTLPVGIYELTVTAIDLVSSQNASSSLIFRTIPGH